MVEVHTFKPVVVGDSYRFDADEMLEAAKGQGFSEIAIIGHLGNGELWISGSANAGATLILMELAKHRIVHGDE